MLEAHNPEIGQKEGPGLRAASALSLAPCMLRVAVESAVRARQTDCPMVQAPLRDRSIARVVAPLLPTERPNSCPGRRPSRRARIGKAGPRVEGSSQMKETPIYTGIDVAKGRLDVALRPSGEYVEATNDERGIHSVVRRLRKENVALAVLEATGGLEQPAAAALALAGVPVAIVNPRQVRDVRGLATGKLAKTDRIDAALLAHYFAEAVRPEHHAPWPTNMPAN